MPSLCKIRRSDIIHISNEGKTDHARRVSSSSPLRVHSLFSTNPANNAVLNVQSTNECIEGVRIMSDCGGDRDRASSDAKSRHGEEDKENSEINASSIASGSNNNENKIQNRRTKKRELTLDAYFKPTSRLNTDDSDDEESISEDEDVPKKKQRTTKLLSLNEDAKPIVLHIPFANNEKYAEVRITSHCVKNKYIVDDDPIVLSGETMYPACTRLAIERFLPGFGRYIH